MRAIGNTPSNQKYNPNNKPPPTTSFSGGDTSEEILLERYIRDKYERKAFIPKASSIKHKPLPSPSFTPDPDKVNAILGPPSSTNLKLGQRVSGDSFERARSPASTNSSVELPPPKPPRPAATGQVNSGNPFDE